MTLKRAKSKRSGRNTERKKNFKLKFLTVFLTIVSLSLLYIWQTVTVITLSARAKELKLEIAQKQKTRKYLQIKVTQLNSVQRIERLAELMGFVYPGARQTGLICESSDSTYLERPALAKNIWSKLRRFQKAFLSVGDEALAKEVDREP